MEQNPIVKELNYKKPNLVFSYDNELDNDRPIASYDITANVIETSPNTMKDFYIVFAANDESHGEFYPVDDPVDIEEAKKKHVII